MPGNHEQGLKAAETNKKFYGEDYYAKIGSLGGKKGHTGGFYTNRELARIAGAKGGRISRRGKSSRVVGAKRPAHSKAGERIAKAIDIPEVPKKHWWDIKR